MGINIQKARNNSKSSALFIIKDIRILHNYLTPFLDKLHFLSKKAQDFVDFKIITRAVYYGIHKQEKVRSLILKLSYNMNSFRLSNYSGKISLDLLTKDERDFIINTLPLIEHL